MRILGLRVPVVVLVFALGLAGLFSFNYLYKYSHVNQPLSGFFAGHREVLDYRIDERGDQVVVTLRLGPVANLRETFLALEKGTTGILGNRPFRLEIQDNRDARLRDDYYRLHYSLQEALSTGQFNAMARAVSEQGRSLGLRDAKAFVDERYLYVQLQRGDRYLYELLPRIDARVGALVLEGGRVK